MRSRRHSVAIVAPVLGVAAIGVALVLRMESKVNRVALDSLPKGVSTALAKGTTFRTSRSYVGALRPWIEAKVGPQLVSAYVDTVLVRPGARVKRGDVLATLDCRDTNGEQAAVAMQARAIEVRQKAVADEADRTRRLLDGGYASANEVEQALAQSASESAQLDAQRAKMARGTVATGDCILRAPFDGEVGDRYIDPGAFARPGTAVVSVVDRTTIRYVADAPESDFLLVAPGTTVHVHADATGKEVDGTVSRRAPHADPDVRTVRFEVDIPDPDRSLPSDTTAEARIDYGAPVDATQIPLYAATVRGPRASVFVVDRDRARLRVVQVLGETGDALIVDRALAPSTAVVTEGRALLNDGDRVLARMEAPVVVAPPSSLAEGAKP